MHIFAHLSSTSYANNFLFSVLAQASYTMYNKDTGQDRGSRRGIRETRMYYMPSGSRTEGHQEDTKMKNTMVALILSIFLGYLGVDRMYLGKWGTGILKLLTGGGFVIWYVYDVIMIAMGKMTDKNGNALE